MIYQLPDGVMNLEIFKLIYECEVYLTEYELTRRIDFKNKYNRRIAELEKKLKKTDNINTNFDDEVTNIEMILKITIDVFKVSVSKYYSYHKKAKQIVENENNKQRWQTAKK